MNAAAGSGSNSSRRKGLSRGQSIGLVVICTILGAAGQILIKMGANTLTQLNPLAMLMNPPLFAGYGLYAIMTVLFIFALRDDELSVLYPIISLTYVWVAGLSVWFFKEMLNVPKVAGIVTIVAGVCVLGKEARK